MSETRRTRSGYEYTVVSADEIVNNAHGYFTWSCGEKHCGALIQGGEGALAEHRRTVHPETEGTRTPVR